MDQIRFRYRQGCFFCGKPLLNGPTELRTCQVCGMTELSDCHCPGGHFVCSVCHSAEMEELLIPVLTQSEERDPLRLLEQMMDLPAVHLHGPEHHILVPCVLLAAYHRCGGKLAMSLEKALAFALRRARQLPGGHLLSPAEHTCVEHPPDAFRPVSGGVDTGGRSPVLQAGKPHLHPDGGGFLQRRIRRGNAGEPDHLPDFPGQPGMHRPALPILSRRGSSARGGHP